MKLNFKNLMKLISGYICESKKLNQVDFLFCLFGYFSEKNPNFYFDNGRVCKWLKGSAPVSNKIVKFYTRSSSNFLKLTEDVKNFLLPCFYDKAKVISELHSMVSGDETLSIEKRTELLQNYNCEEHFLTDLIIFALERHFEKE